MLYRKKLNSIEELKREKIRLRYERMHTKTSDLNPIAEMGKKKKGGDVAASNFLSLALSLLSAKNSSERVMKIAPFLMKRLNKRKKSKDGKAGKSMIARLTGEVLTSYLVGKTILVSASLLTGYIKKRRVRAKEQKILSKMHKMGWH